MSDPKVSPLNPVAILPPGFRYMNPGEVVLPGDFYFEHPLDVTGSVVLLKASPVLFQALCPVISEQCGLKVPSHPMIFFFVRQTENPN